MTIYGFYSYAKVRSFSNRVLSLFKLHAYLCTVGTRNTYEYNTYARIRYLAAVVLAGDVKRVLCFIQHVDDWRYV